MKNGSEVEVNQVNEYPWILAFADKTGTPWTEGCGATLVSTLFRKDKDNDKDKDRDKDK